MNNNKIKYRPGDSVAFRFPPHNTVYFGKVSAIHPNGSIEIKRDPKFLVMTTATVGTENILAAGQ